MALMWAVALVFVVIMPLGYPALESSSHFSTSLVEPAPELDLLRLFVPAHPFQSMASGMVPATVVFSPVLGTAASQDAMRWLGGLLGPLVLPLGRNGAAPPRARLTRSARNQAACNTQIPRGRHVHPNCARRASSDPTGMSMCR